MAIYTNPPQRLGAVLGEVIDKLGYRDKIDEARAVECWPELAGPAIENVTEAVWMRDGKLFVKIHSAVWRHQLHLQREQWKARINEHLRREVVIEVVFR